SAQAKSRCRDGRDLSLAADGFCETRHLRVAFPGSGMTEDGDLRRPWLSSLVTGGVILTAALAVGTVVATVAGRWWVGDLAVHFPAQYAVMGAAAFVGLAWAGRRVSAAVALLIAVANAMIAAPLLERLPPPKMLRVTSAGTPLRLASINVFY